MMVALRNRVNQTNYMNTTHQSTYALLVRSEEKKRGLLEIVVYALFILSAVAAIFQFANQPVTVPAAGFQPSSCLTCANQEAVGTSQS